MTAAQDGGAEALRDALLRHHPIAHTMTGPLKGCRCGQVGLGQDVIAHVAAELCAAQDGGAQSAVRRVEALAESWRYKGEFGWGPWQRGEGPDIEGQILDEAASQLRAALAPQVGDGAR